MALQERLCMNHFLLLATSHGVHTYERAGNTWRETARGLIDHNVTSIIAREGVILAGTTDGVFRSDDLGKTWHDASAGLTTRHVRWMAYHPDISDFEFAGTEPASIFVSRDGAASWRECPEIPPLRDAHKWFLPYSPRAGCVRSFAFHATRAYAAVEVGGALRSDDRGETWRLCDGSTGDPRLDAPPALYIYPDVHSIAAHPSSPNLVFAPTGGGYYASRDGGKTWELLYDCYSRAVWIDPNDAAHQVLGPADGVSRNGRIEETRDGGKSWRAASNGLRVPWRQHMVERFAQIGDELLAVLSNGELLSAPLASFQWQPILAEVKDIAAVTLMK
jgi:photosystem II stability/assembly factor-like uncharacterized protein